MAGQQPIGEMLIEKGKITKNQLDTALHGKYFHRRRTGEMLVSLGYVTEQDVTDCLAKQYGLAVVDAHSVKPEPQALDLLRGETALAHRILPLRYTDDYIECIMADPIDFPTTDMISRLAGKRAVLHLATASELITSIRKAYHLCSKTEHKRDMSEHPAIKLQEDRECILAKLETGI